MKPRQPGLNDPWCQFRQTEVLGDERASTVLNPRMPFPISQMGHFLFFYHNMEADKNNE